MDQVGKCVINKVRTWLRAAEQQFPWRRAGGAAEPVAEEVEESKQDAERGLRSHQAPPQGEVNQLNSVGVSIFPIPRSCSDPEVDTTEVDKMKIHPGK